MDQYLDFLKSKMSKKTKVIVSENIQQDIIKFFLDNPNPDDEKVHKLADELKINPHELETNIYEILSNLLKVGKHRDTPVGKFDPEQIKMGIAVEKEHTDDPSIAVEIAKDHLAEIPDYYTRLKAMEDTAKKKG